MANGERCKNCGLQESDHQQLELNESNCDGYKYNEVDTRREKLKLAEDRQQSEKLPPQ